MFDVIGVKPVNFRVGQYKSFVEPYIRAGYERENRAAYVVHINITDYMYTKIGDLAASQNGD
jgi:hypothetical protein